MLVIGVSLGSAFSISELLPYVSPERRVMSSRLKREDDIRRSLIGDIMARLFAMDIEGMRNDEIHFETGVFGKPRLKQMRKSWDYNISHSGKWITGIAGQVGQRVGIDVQRMDDVASSLSRYRMSTEEMKLYLSLPPKEQKYYFYELWTRKESYLKMEGLGITDPIRAVFSEEGSMDQGILSHRNGGPAHYFKQYPIDSGYTLSACSTDFRFPDVCLLVRASDLAGVFLRRCREQSGHTLPDTNKLPVISEEESVLQHHNK